MVTEDDIITLVEAEIEKMHAKRRAKRVIDAARHELRKQKCRRQGIAVDSAQCTARVYEVMQRANEALMQQHESRPIRPFAPDNTKLLTEVADYKPERERAWKAAMEELERTGSVVISGRYPWALPEDDGTIPTGAV